jgi:MFS transporter, ACS family, hexuronate transporter
LTTTASQPQTSTEVQDVVPAKAWFILALLTLESIMGIIDRQSISALKSTLKAEFMMTDVGFSYLVNAFLIPYALFYPICGYLVDKYGTRRTLSAFVIIWSAATLACGVARSLPEMIVYRAIIGAAEAGLLPASLMALVIWFPKAKIATAGSLRSAFQSIGPIIVTPLVVAITLAFSWHYAFILPGLIGIFFGVMWWFADRNPPTYASAAVAPAVKPKVIDILRSKELWGVLIARIISDPLWFFISYWQAGYLQEKLGLSLKDLGYVLWIPPLVASLIMVSVGVFSDRLVKAGWTPARSRIRILQGLAVLGPAIYFVPSFTSLPVVLGLLTAAYFLAYAWLVVTNILITDLFRNRGVGVAVGLVNMCGTFASAAFTWGIGATLATLGYGPVFLALACLHPIAAVVLQLAYGKTIQAEPSTEEAKAL